MLVATKQDGTRKLAWTTEKTDGPFFCPACQELVILKKGPVREHHFAHKPPITCQYGMGETSLHLSAKRAMYETLHTFPGCSKCELERPLKGVRPDVSLYIGKYPVAIELQRSAIKVDEIRRRTTQYTKLGIYTLWILPFVAPVDEVLHRPSEWEKYLHALYFGKVYFWAGGAWLNSVHFNRHQIWVEERSWFEDHDEMTAGGYFRTMKSVREVELGTQLLHVALDFSPKPRQELKIKRYTLPQALLWASD